MGKVSNKLGRVYVDTSAYLSLLLGEPGHARVSVILKRKILCSSSFLFLEAERNLVRFAREGVIDARTFQAAQSQLLQDMSIFILRDFTTDLCLTSIFPAVLLPRSSDLAHLRTAKWFEDEGGLDGFLTLDKKQAQAARELGLRCLLPV